MNAARTSGAAAITAAQAARIRELEARLEKAEQERDDALEALEAARAALAGQEAITGMVRADAERRMDEERHRIAGALRGEWADFQSAIGLEMSPDLGENMRDQLDSVFGILARHGIPLGH